MRRLFGALAKDWFALLTPPQREAWNLYARRIHRRWRPGRRTLTGQQAYLKLNSVLGRIGRPPLLWPPPQPSAGIAPPLGRRTPPPRIARRPPPQRRFPALCQRPVQPRLDPYAPPRLPGTPPRPRRRHQRHYPPLPRPLPRPQARRTGLHSNPPAPPRLGRPQRHSQRPGPTHTSPSTPVPPPSALPIPHRARRGGWSG
jgi:hypothetical protein